MTKPSICCLAAALCWLPASAASAQSGIPGTNLTVATRVRSVVVTGDTTSITYSLLNDTTSTEKLWQFTVKVTAGGRSVPLPGAPSDWDVDTLYRGFGAAHWAMFNNVVAGDSSATLSVSAIGVPGIADAWYRGDSIEWDPDTGETVNVHDPLNDESVKTQTLSIVPIPPHLRFPGRPLAHPDRQLVCSGLDYR